MKPQRELVLALWPALSDRTAAPMRAAPIVMLRSGLVLVEVVLAISLTATLALTAALWPALFERTAVPVRAVLDLAAAANAIEEHLRRDLHLAGWSGCASRVAAVPPALMPPLGVYTTATGAPALAVRGLERARPGSAVLLIQHLDPRQLLRVERSALTERADGSWELSLDREAELERGDEVLLTDCRKTVAATLERLLLRGQLLVLRPATADREALAGLSGEIELAPLVRRLYYLDGSATLYRLDAGHPATALVEGVEGWRMRLRTAGGPFAVLEVESDLVSPQPLPGRDNPRLRRTLELEIAAYNRP